MKTDKNKRMFVPSSKFVGRTSVPTEVRFWRWIRGHGLTVTYLDGRTMKSGYTLKELIAAEKPTEV